MTTAADPPQTTRPGTTEPTTADGRRRRVSARVRIVLWLLLVMAVALAAVATTTRSILLRDAHHRINGLLAQEAGEFTNFVDRGVDPATGRPFSDPARLLRVFLERQNADPDEELIGIAGRAAAFLVGGARTVRQLVHLTTAALVVTAFAVPATSGRAALALPVFLALAKALADRRRLVVMLAVLFPTVILLSAVATLIGAGAHLITVSVLWEAAGERIGFTQWLLLGLPLAVASSHLAAEAVLLTTTRRADRRAAVHITAEEIQEHSKSPVTGPWTQAEKRCALLLGTVVALWCSEPLHQVPPAVVALIGAIVASSPALGTVRLKDALKTVPWSLLLFMAATMAMGVALADSGAAQWVVSGLPTEVTPGGVPDRRGRGQHGGPSGAAVPLRPLLGAGSAGGGGRRRRRSQPGRGRARLHRSRRLLPHASGLREAGHPFADIPGTPTYTPRDLLRLSAVLAPLTAALVLLFAVAVWPLLGVPVVPQELVPC
ncbi:anion permease [Streptomyces sp. PSKA30]|nr:anion permease [Streptomyces sp. PSKA30]